MKEIKINKKYVIICSIIFAIFTVLGYSYHTASSWSLIFTNWKTICVSLLQIIVYTLLFTILIHMVIKMIQWYSKKQFKETKMNQFFSKHSFIISIIIMLIGWLIYVIAFYPTIMTIDAYNQLKQFFGLKNYYTDTVVTLSENMLITNHHPVLHTWLLGGFVKLGRIVFNDNFGLFLYSALQIGVLAGALAYTISYLKSQKVKNRFLYILLLIYALVPVFPFYAMTATKDVLYTAFLIFFVIEIHKLVTQNAKLNRKKAIYLIILSVLISLMRNNGIFIVIPVWLVLFFYSKENKKKIGIILASSVCLFLLYMQVLLPFLNITPGSKREVLSIPFQQTARYVKTYENEVTQEEKEAIDKVLDYELIDDLYAPNNADPVKGTYNKYATEEDLKNYFKVWFAQFMKHPGVYFEATFNNIYGYFYPSLSDTYLYYQDINHPLLKIIANFGYLNYNENFMDYHFNDSFENLREMLVSGAQAFQYIPGLGAIVNIAMNNWIVILLVAYFCSKKQKRNIIILLPSIMTILTCLASPANNYFRYAMPIIFTNPFIIAWLVGVRPQTEKSANQGQTPAGKNVQTGTGFTKK